MEESDQVFIPGMNFDYANIFSFRAQTSFFKWLKNCSDKKNRGAFVRRPRLSSNIWLEVLKRVADYQLGIAGMFRL